VKSELDNLFENLDEGDKLTEAEPCAVRYGDGVCFALAVKKRALLSSVTQNILSEVKG